MDKNIAIKVQNLTKTYKLYKDPKDRLKEALNPFGKKYHKDFYALKDISFEIKKGETVGIIGRNGSGKSTLLKIITGVLTPSSGKSSIYGKISAILELGAGFNPEMSGLENIYLNSSINGLSKIETDKIVDEIISFSELEEFIYQPVKTYSSGMKARLGFAVAINIEPDLLIVDEALAVGDAAFQRKCYAKMEKIREAGATILFVSHSANTIIELCTSAIWLSNGEKVIEGDPKLITELYMKNSQKKHIDKQTIIEEFNKLLNKRIKLKEGIYKRKQENKDTLFLTIQDSKLNSSKEYYDPSLKPKSTIYYEEKGARITGIKVTTLSGKEVNVLISGNTYIYTYNILLNELSSNINCGFLIKTKNGVALGGGSYNIIEYIKDKKEIITIKWFFKANLTANVFFFNAGVSGDNGFLHRVIDSYCIRILPKKDKNLKITSFVNFIEDIKVC